MEKSRGVLIAGNWKMNQNLAETESFFKALSARCEQLRFSKKLRVCLFPPVLSLFRAKETVDQNPGLGPIALGAQNAHWEKKGAFTGEVSGPMLHEIGIEWVLVGHSERRQFFGETDETVRKRAESLLTQGFHVILCVGETQSERESGKTYEVLSRQIHEGFPSVSEELLSRLIFAYEPVWAIGTGLTATPVQAEEVHEQIRKLLEHRTNHSFAQKTPILYGGSVTPENIDSLLDCAHVDGALVGGASLKVDSFTALIQAGIKVLN